MNHRHVHRHVHRRLHGRDRGDGRWRVLGAAALPALLAAGCSAGDTHRGWTDAEIFGWVEAGDPTVVVDGDIWQLQVGDSPYDSGEGPQRCQQPVVRGVPLDCVVIDAPPGRGYGFNATTRVAGERVVWTAETVDPSRPIDHYVVWSSASPDGREIEPIEYADVRNLVWIMEPGEEPWGYQEITADGVLVDAVSLVGLPGE